jgi:mannose-1-phosphate guanylyltransferase
MNSSEPDRPISMPRQAMLLAAGRGERLAPLTDSVSKCMIPIAGRPLLEHNVDALKGFGVTDLVINLHHLPQTITDYFEDGSRFGVHINYSFEPELLGTAGAVRKAASFFDGPFFLWYGDNLSDCNLNRLWKFHHSRKALITIALHRREDPTRSGIVGLDEDCRVSRFLEKPRPDQIFSHWVNAGILVLEHEAIDLITDQQPSDFGRDVLPALLGQNYPIYGYRFSDGESLRWIDTAEDLAAVQQATGAI